MAEELEKWRYPRFFSDTIDENDRIIYMNDEDSKHIAQVLRMRKGDKAIICDKNGHDYLCELSSLENKNAIEFGILDKKDNLAEPDVEITLFQAVPKNDKLDFIVQKATELGAVRIVPFLSKRCVSRPDAKSADKKTPTKIVTAGVTKISIFVSPLTNLPHSVANIAMIKTASGPPAPPKTLAAWPTANIENKTNDGAFKAKAIATAMAGPATALA